MSRYREQLNSYLKLLDVDGKRVLSIGCERDDKSVFNSLKFDEFKTMDIDNRFNPDYVWDLNKPIVDLDGNYSLPDDLLGSFDVIIALNVWEYIYDPVTAHHNIADLLASGGILITNYPFVYPQHEPAGTDFLRYAPDGVYKLLSNSHLVIEDSVPTTGDLCLIDFYRADGMKARQGADHSITGLIIKAKKL